MQKNSGFTLIEMMIVLAIIGILASIAYPAYQEQVRSTRRADCTGALVGLAGAMERFFTTNNTYLGAAAAAADTGAPAPTTYRSTQCPTDGGTATYNLTIQAATSSSYSLQAARTGAQAADKCGTLTLTSTGLKGITGADAGITVQDCW